jgi:hypothetical protein
VSIVTTAPLARRFNYPSYAIAVEKNNIAIPHLDQDTPRFNHAGVRGMAEDQKKLQSLSDEYQKLQDGNPLIL